MKHLLLLLVIVSLPAGQAVAQDAPAQPSPAATTLQAVPESQIEQTPPQLENTIDAQESSEPPERKMVRWNHYEGPYFTIRWGAGLLYEVAGYQQDDTSKEQIE